MICREADKTEKFLLSITLLLLYGCTNSNVTLLSSQSSPQRDLPKTRLQIAGQIITVQVANTSSTRETGLMYRATMPENEGMLFGYEDAKARCFWMKNTPLPLSVAFINTYGQIIDIQHMTPFSELSHCSAGSAQYALEMHQGWFEQHRVKVGDKIDGIK